MHSVYCIRVPPMFSLTHFFSIGLVKTIKELCIMGSRATFQHRIFLYVCGQIWRDKMKYEHSQKIHRQKERKIIDSILKSRAFDVLCNKLLATTKKNPPRRISTTYFPASEDTYVVFHEHVKHKHTGIAPRALDSISKPTP